MAGPKRKAPGAPTTSTPRTTRASTASRRAASARSAVPDVYREMVSEARRMAVTDDAPEATTPERPLKRRRPGERPTPKAETKPTTIPEPTNTDQNNNADDDDDEDLEFEDVEIPKPTVQTITRDSDDEDDEDLEMEDIAFDSNGAFPSGMAGDVQLDLNLSAQKAAMAPHRRAIERRKALSKSEKEQRRDIHKVHLLCLLAHVERRNEWCNSPKVQEALRPLLTDKMRKSLIPRASLNQYGRTESLKAGLQETSTMFKTKFQITERGMRRALWAEDEEQLKNYKLPDDFETVRSKDDFLKAAKSLSGSRDVGAQLFCALLRSIGVQARLVCSLQPLACVPGAPTMPKESKTKSLNASKGPSAADLYAAAMSKYENNTAITPDPTKPSFLSSARSRLGHPNATAYNVPSMTTPPAPVSVSSTPKAKAIKGESPYPIYWVEVLDIAQQKWHPVDPLVTGTQWRPRALEPPASDKGNSLTYAIAFDEDGFATDVTRRYAKAYNSKTKRARIDGPISPVTPSGINTGERWLRRVFLRRYTPPDFPNDLDQIELNELALLESQEPMPRNVQDFKDHPIYALERHLRRNEVLAPGAQSTGTVSAGSKAPVERIYRRKDVVIARSREKWFRLGRVVKPGEDPIKVLPPKRKRTSKFGGGRISSPFSGAENDEDGEEGDLFGDYSLARAGGTPLYTPQQTDLYIPPPVSARGKIPKNKFGNVEVYVPSMVPRGGAHVPHERAAQAAHILGVDYAPALTGFEWKGRKGTARILGVVVPNEAEEGVRAVIEGLKDMEEEEREEARRMEVLRMWRVFLRGLRIRERVFGGVEKEKETEEERFDREMADAPSDVSEEFYMDMDDEEGGGGGGFLIE
ncbi:hypothetical protein B0T20DRAFT_370404 [Sordaria brevicollis]|uniref:Rad4-domain-containing protein n=1 Tax=Sordaria brevicollis TaxID=83679 RepID=A0AAE0UFK1_SORBR|nr:hypothetical protein B0T20DRAFT_370404 [Sordaria brevicollis]